MASRRHPDRNGRAAGHLRPPGLAARPYRRHCREAAGAPEPRPPARRVLDQPGILARARQNGLNRFAPFRRLQAPGPRPHLISSPPRPFGRAPPMPGHPVSGAGMDAVLPGTRRNIYLLIFTTRFRPPAYLTSMRTSRTGGLTGAHHETNVPRVVRHDRFIARRPRTR